MTSSHTRYERTFSCRLRGFLERERQTVTVQTTSSGTSTQYPLPAESTSASNILRRP